MNEERKVHHSSEECKQSFLDTFEHMTQNNPSWLAAVWTVEDNTLTVFRTTNKFDKSLYHAALMRLKAMLDEELEAMFHDPTREPLPIAPHLKLANESNVSSEEKELPPEYKLPEDFEDAHDSVD